MYTSGVKSKNKSNTHVKRAFGWENDIPMHVSGHGSGKEKNSGVWCLGFGVGRHSRKVLLSMGGGFQALVGCKSSKQFDVMLFLHVVHIEASPEPIIVNQV